MYVSGAKKEGGLLMLSLRFIMLSMNLSSALNEKEEVVGISSFKLDMLLIVKTRDFIPLFAFIRWRSMSRDGY